uniref:Uncharacterized protein n=1 Tax=Micrurus paraensis TaxID=1970185 RepID=A0A2D4K1E1_9SAUR
MGSLFEKYRERDGFQIFCWFVVKPGHLGECILFTSTVKKNLVINYNYYNVYPNSSANCCCTSKNSFTVVKFNHSLLGLDNKTIQACPEYLVNIRSNMGKNRKKLFSLLL